MDLLSQIQETKDFILSKADFTGNKGIILGTGLGELVDHIQNPTTLNYEEIPHFPVSTVESHSGKLIFGELSGTPVVVMQGRFHYYEGYDMKQITFPVRVMRVLGVETLYISNVSGGLNPEYEVGDIMVISDHINLLPDNPLRGKNHEELGPRFPDMLGTYTDALREKAMKIGREKGFNMHEGVYVSVMGPNLETPAEYGFLRKIGADAVGMSTVPEVIAARHAGMDIFGISIITDLGVPGKIKPINIPEIIEVAMATQPKLTQIVQELIAD